MTRQFSDHLYLDGSFDDLRQVLAGPPESWLPAPARREGPSVVVDLTEGSDSSVPALVSIGLPRFEVADERLVVPISWRAEEHRAIYPQLDATLELVPLASDRTQLTIAGSYRVPAGVIGEAVDLLVGHTIVEAVVRDFLSRVAARAELAVNTLTS